MMIFMLRFRQRQRPIIYRTTMWFTSNPQA